MGEPRTVPAVSAPDAEVFLTDGTPTNSVETSENLDSSPLDPRPGAANLWTLDPLGVDLPGVGHVFPGRKNSVDSPAELLQQLGEKTSESREVLKAERDALLAELLFAARDLANRGIRTIRMPRTDDAGNGEISICKECGGIVNGVAPLPHTKVCRVGRVRRILDDLVELANPAYQIATKDKKEGAPEGESAGAGDGIRLRGEGARLVGDVRRACGKCGGRFGVWRAEQKPEAEVELRLLGSNQCVTAGVDGHGHTLYTHYCDGIDFRESLSFVEGGAE
jgi:hypothetical protein